MSQFELEYTINEYVITFAVKANGQMISSIDYNHYKKTRSHVELVKTKFSEFVQKIAVDGFDNFCVTWHNDTDTDIRLYCWYKEIGLVCTTHGSTSKSIIPVVDQEIVITNLNKIIGQLSEPSIWDKLEEQAGASGAVY